MNAYNTNIFPPLSIRVISMGTTEPADFFWTMEYLPSNDTLPAMGLCLQYLKLLGLDTSHFSKLSWRAQAN
jgi:hypothetical protein